MGFWDAVPLVSQATSAVQAMSGDMEGARRTQENFSKRCPVVSQARSAVEATYDTAAAKKTQEEFAYNMPVVSQVTSAVYAARGNNDKAKEIQETFAETNEDAPLLGYGISAGYGVAGDKNKARRAAAACTGSTMGTAAGLATGGMSAGAGAATVAAGAAAGGVAERGINNTIADEHYRTAAGGLSKENWKSALKEGAVAGVMAGAPVQAKYTAKEKEKKAAEEAAAASKE